MTRICGNCMSFGGSETRGYCYVFDKDDGEGDDKQFNQKACRMYRRDPEDAPYVVKSNGVIWKMKIVGKVKEH